MLYPDWNQLPLYLHTFPEEPPIKMWRQIRCLNVDGRSHLKVTYRHSLFMRQLTKGRWSVADLAQSMEQGLESSDLELLDELLSQDDFGGLFDLTFNIHLKAGLLSVNWVKSRLWTVRDLLGNARLFSSRADDNNTPSWPVFWCGPDEWLDLFKEEILQLYRCCSYTKLRESVGPGPVTTYTIRLEHKIDLPPPDILELYIIDKRWIPL